MQIDPSIFKAYDIRGITGQTLTPEIVYTQWMVLIIGVIVTLSSLIMSHNVAKVMGVNLALTLALILLLENFAMMVEQ